MGKELVLKRGQLEEPVVLLDLLHIATAVGALAIDQVLLGEEGLARCAVQAFVRILVQVTVVEKRLEEFLNAHLVTMLRGADEVIVGDVKVAPQVGELGNLGVAPFLRGHAMLGGRLSDLLPMLIHAGEEMNVRALKTLEARNGVGCNRRVGGADMGHAVNVINGSCKVKGLLRH